MSVGPTALGLIEPHVHLAGPRGVLVIGVEPAPSDTVSAAYGSEHHQVVAEHAFRCVFVVVVHGVHDSGVVT